MLADRISSHSPTSGDWSLNKGSIVCKPNLSNNRLPAQQTSFLQRFPGICVANRGPKLGNGRDNNIVAGKWFGLVTTAASKIFKRCFLIKKENRNYLSLGGYCLTAGQCPLSNIWVVPLKMHLFFGFFIRKISLSV